MQTRRTLLAVAIVLSLLLALGYSCTAQTPEQTLLKDTTTQIQKAVQAELDYLDQDMSVAVSQLSRTGLGGPEAREILNLLYSKHPFIIDCLTTDTSGKIVTVAPEDYSKYEGTDISQQAVTIEFWKTKQPMLSQLFTAVEGTDGVVIIWPVLSEKGDFIGSLSSLFVPELFFTAVSEPVLQGTGIGLDVMQLDGLDLYDSAGVDTGTNLFTDPELQPFTELVALSHKIVAKKSGWGSYTVTDHATGQTVKKQAYWVTVGLHGTDWRLVGGQKVAEQPAETK